MYDSLYLMWRGEWLHIRSNSIIPVWLLYKRQDSTSKALKSGDIRVGYTPIARDVYLNYWLQVRKADLSIVGPVETLSWAGEIYQKSSGIYLLALIYKIYPHNPKYRHKPVNVISFVGRTQHDRVIEPLLVPRKWKTTMLEEMYDHYL